MAAPLVNFTNPGNFATTNFQFLWDSRQSGFSDGRRTANYRLEGKATTSIQDKSVSNCGWIACLAAFLLLALTGCQGAPSFRIASLIFPDWISCSLVGITFSFGVYRLLVTLKLEDEIQPAVLIYPNVALSCSLTLWLLFFG